MSDDFIMIAQEKQYEQYIEELTDTGRFRVLRKLELPDIPFSLPWIFEPEVGLIKFGLVIDTETTGWGEEAKIINYGHILFSFSPIHGRILAIHAIYDGYEDPGMPLDPNITYITGITDEMIAGSTLAHDMIEILRDVNKADIVIAHNASFDRPFLERRIPEFKDKVFGCTLCQINWATEAVSSKTLSYLLSVYGWFFDAHRAINDCFATVHLLRQNTPRTDTNILLLLWRVSRQRLAQIWAVGAAFETKDTLRMEGFKWNTGEDGRPKAWFKTVQAGDEEEATMAWLSANVYGTRNNAKITYITAKDRFSIRE